MTMNDDSQFVDWFRAASPYIHQHRGSTFVVYFGGEALTSSNFSALIHDLALLSSLGIRLVVVHGIRPQIEQEMERDGLTPRYALGLRITDAESLASVKRAVGACRVEIEALFSTGLVNSPMGGAQIRVASGNFVTARPLGIRDGIDFCHTGEVRRISTQSINQRLDSGEIVLVSPIGYSPTGEVFNLSAFDVAASVSVALGAHKLVMLTEGELGLDQNGQLLREMTPDVVEQRLVEEPGAQTELLCALAASQNGVQRVHMINRLVNGGVLLELFSRDGVGTMLSAAPFDEIRKATIEDIGGILELIIPMEQKGILVKRSREKLEMEVHHFTVMVRDNAIIGCIALYLHENEQVAELSCLAIRHDYRNHGRGELLFNAIEKEAKRFGLSKLFVLTTQTAHWFIEQGFVEGQIEDLPSERQTLYNFQRNSKVFFKTL